MGLYRRGPVWWFEFRHKGERIRFSTGHTSKPKAARAAQLERERITVGVTDESHGLTLAEAAASWWRMRGETLKSADTIAHRLEIARRHIGFDREITAITTGDIAEAMTSRRKDITHNRRPPTPSTINRDIIDTLRPVFTHARKVLGRPVQDIDWTALRMKEPRHRVREFSQAEYEAVLTHLPAHYHGLLAFLALYGVRLSEAFFSLADFDRDTGRVRLRERKGGGDHTITLLDADRRLLAVQASRAGRAGLDTVWFRAERNGELVRLRPGSFQHAMRKAYKKAGILNARPAHDWRHHALTAYVRATGDLRAAQHLAGHENIATTARYAHASDAVVLAGLEKVLKASAHKNAHNPGKRSRKALK
ncbi:MAG: tyrosine-type recombinase/integrase [Glycocaulis sp.]